MTLEKKSPTASFVISSKEYKDPKLNTHRYHRISDSTSGTMKGKDSYFYGGLVEGSALVGLGAASQINRFSTFRNSVTN